VGLQLHVTVGKRGGLCRQALDDKAGAGIHCSR
jgi:hypothetical protein